MGRRTRAADARVTRDRGRRRVAVGVTTPLPGGCSHARYTSVLSFMRGPLRTSIIVAVTVALLWFFLRSADLGGVWRSILAARWDLLALGLLFTAVSWLLRVVRWLHLLAPIGRVGFMNAFRATMIGFAASAVAPGRVGEVLRPYVLARREGFSATAAFGTIVVERLLDLVTLSLLLLLAVFQVTLGPEISGGAARLVAAIETGAVVAGLVGLALGAAIFMAARDPARAGRAVLRLERVAPGGLVGRMARAVQRLVEGMAVMRAPLSLAAAMAWSVPLWCAAAFAIWAVSNAFDIAVPLSGSAIMTGFVVVGVAVPTPAGIGGYHAAYQIGATALWSAPVESAVGAAILLHAITFVPVTLVGLVCMLQEGLKLTHPGEFAAAAASDDARYDESLSPPVPVLVGTAPVDDGGLS
jgi:uncharacterized protein (TIRG00374 family)